MVRWLLIVGGLLVHGFRWWAVSLRRRSVAVATGVTATVARGFLRRGARGGGRGADHRCHEIHAARQDILEGLAKELEGVDIFRWCLREDCLSLCLKDDFSVRIFDLKST